MIEYANAVSHYQGIRPQLAQAFVASVQAGIEHILDHPEAWPAVEGNVRRHFIRRFPFGIYYRIDDDLITVYAVLHMRRQPDAWRGRL